MPLIGWKTLRSALLDTRRKLGVWGLVLVASAVAVGIIGALEHGRFGIESVSGTVVFVVAVLVGGYLVFAALATGRLEADRDRWRRDYDVVNSWVNATKAIRMHLAADYADDDAGVRLFAENVISAIKLSKYPSAERIREVETLAGDESMPPSERHHELVKLLRTRLDEDAFLRPG
ncbi:MAG: hypothetical protein ACJ757_10635 [Gaiellaceae bacterium]